MTLNMDRLVVTPWWSSYPQATFNPYLPTSAQCLHSFYDNGHQAEPEQNHLHRTSVHGGILKPKPIRISRLEQFARPRFSNYQTGVPSNVLQFKGRRDDGALYVGSAPRNHQEWNLCPSVVVADFPYFHPCSYSFREHEPADSVFTEILRKQLQLLDYYKTHEYRRHDKISFDVDENIHRTLNVSSTDTHNIRPQSSITCNLKQSGPEKAAEKQIQFSLRNTAEIPSIDTNFQEPKRTSYLTKQKNTRHTVYRKRFLMTFSTSRNQNTTKKPNSAPLKRSITERSLNNIQKKVCCSKAKYLVENTLTESSGDVSSFNKSNYLTSSSNSEKNETSIAAVSFENNLSKNDERKKFKESGLACSVQPSFSEEKKSFKCPQCRYLTDRKNNLKRHIITMHQESTKILECCGIGFQNKASLRDHNAIFHRGGYRCQICSRNFCRKALLRRHLTVHSGHKDFFCHICGYATSHKSNLERHQKVHMKRGTIGRKSVSVKMTSRLERATSSSVKVQPSYADSLHGNQCVSLKSPCYQVTGRFSEIGNHQKRNLHEDARFSNKDKNCNSFTKNYENNNKLSVPIKNTLSIPNSTEIDLENFEKTNDTSHSGLLNNFDCEKLNKKIKPVQEHKADSHSLNDLPDSRQNIEDVQKSQSFVSAIGKYSDILSGHLQTSTVSDSRSRSILKPDLDAVFKKKVHLYNLAYNSYRWQRSVLGQSSPENVSEHIASLGQ